MNSRPAAHCAVRFAILLLAAAIGGCDVQQQAAPVEPFLARDTLERVLDGWKSGAQPGDFGSQEPRVVVQDLEWQGGATLLSYKLLSPGDPIDANLHCPVRLVTRDSTGTESTKEVTYIIGTDPVLTVFRQIL